MIAHPETAAQALIGLFGFAALIIFWLGPRRWLATDYARDEMFAARDEFFDEAASGTINFNDRNYKRIREAINSNIRFAHEVSFVRTLIHLRWLARHRGIHSLPDARGAADAIASPSARWAAHRALNRVERAALRLLFLRSPIIGGVLLAWILIKRVPLRNFSSFKHSLHSDLKTYSDAIQAEALTA